MSQDSTHPVPGSGTQADPANTSSGTAQVNAGETSPKSTPAEKKARAKGRNYDASKSFARQSKVLDASAGSSDKQVQLEAELVRHCGSVLNQSATSLRLALATLKSAGEARDQAEATLSPAMGAVFWPIRMQSGGPEFLKDRDAATHAEKVERVLEALPGSSFKVPSELLDGLKRQLGPAQAAAAEYDRRSGEAELAKKKFLADRANLDRAIRVLKRSLEHEKYASLIPLVPAKGELSVEQPAPGKTAKKKSV